MKRFIFIAGTRRSRTGAAQEQAVMTRAALPAPAQRAESRFSRWRRYVLRQLAFVVALLILFYATSLHGISLRTFLLAGLLVLCLYWLFKDAL